jgi:hypothetical protein
MQGHNRWHTVPVCYVLFCFFTQQESFQRFGKASVNSFPFMIQIIYHIQSIMNVKNGRTIFPETGHTILPKIGLIDLKNCLTNGFFQA